MTDNSELKRLAEAATPGPWGYDGSYICPVRVESDGAQYVESWNPVADALLSKNVSYIAAANPAAVLALLAENERLQHDLDLKSAVTGDYVAACQRLQDERDQLKTENEALHSQAQALQSDANSWQSGYDAGRLAAQTHVDSWRVEAERLRVITAELRAFTVCEHLHHALRDQHRADEPCKVLVRIDAALTQEVTHG